MNFGLHFAAGCALTAFLALCAPASAATISYDLAGNTNAAYTEPAYPGWTYIDLADSNSGSTDYPGFTLNVGDTVQVSLTLNHPVSFNYIDIALQSTNGSSTIWYDQTALFSLGGVAVPEPSSNWYHFVGTTGGLDFATGFETGTGTFTFDKVIVNTVITALTDPLGGNVSSIVLTRSKYPVYAGFYGANVATTPLPGALLLMMTALGGLGIFAGRRRAAAAVA